MHYRPVHAIRNGFYAEIDSSFRPSSRSDKAEIVRQTPTAHRWLDGYKCNSQVSSMLANAEHETCTTALNIENRAWLTIVGWIYRTAGHSDMTISHKLTVVPLVRLLMAAQQDKVSK